MNQMYKEIGRTKESSKNWAGMWKLFGSVNSVNQMPQLAWLSLPKELGPDEILLYQDIDEILVDRHCLGEQGSILCPVDPGLAYGKQIIGQVLPAYF